MVTLTSVGPAVADPTFNQSVLDTDPEDQNFRDLFYLENGLARLAPTFSVYTDNIKVLTSKVKYPDPLDANPFQPEVVSLMFQIPGIEPEIWFRSFIAGVGTMALLVEDSLIGGIQQSLQMVAEKIVNGGELPDIDADFYDDWKEIDAQVFSNGEPMSWRSLLSFCRGMFWLLSFVKDPRKPLGRKKLSPMDWAKQRMSTSIKLGFIPQSD